MRPKVTVNVSEVYECYGCGSRADDPIGRFCPTCGNELRNIGSARDL